MVYKIIDRLLRAKRDLELGGELRHLDRFELLSQSRGGSQAQELETVTSCMSVSKCNHISPTGFGLQGMRRLASATQNIPIPTQEPHDQRVGRLAGHDPALAQQPLTLESQTFERAL